MILINIQVIKFFAGYFFSIFYLALIVSSIESFSLPKVLGINCTEFTFAKKAGKICRKAMYSVRHNNHRKKIIKN